VRVKVNEAQPAPLRRHSLKKSKWEELQLRNLARNTNSHTLSPQGTIRLFPPAGRSKGDSSGPCLPGAYEPPGRSERVGQILG